MSRRKKSNGPLVVVVILLALVLVLLILFGLQQQGIIDFLPGVTGNSSSQDSVPSSQTDSSDLSGTESSAADTSASDTSASDTSSTDNSLSESAASRESEVSSSSDAGSSQNLESSSDSSSLSSSQQTSQQADSSGSSQNTVSTGSYDEIMVDVLTEILGQHFDELAAHVGSQGLRLSPTGVQTADDVVLSSSEVASFLSGSSRSYGISPGSGQSLELTPSEYYSRYMYPDGFDFANAVTAYNDEADLALCTQTSDPETVSFYYSANAIEWKKIILVFTAESSDSDVLCGIIYKDQSSN